jgi:formate dehydrogenase iron-sulfur subunit
MEPLGLLIDFTECIGCGECVEACKQANALPPEPNPQELSADTYTVVLQKDDLNYRKLCMHCLEPSCVSACLVGSLTQTEEGAVVYDADKCIGCRYCMLACPFHIPRYEWEATFPFVKKCNMCLTKLRKHEQPACVDACPNEALEFGKRHELLELAHNRIRSMPSKYISHVWGEHEFGGTSILYLSDVDLNRLGWPQQEAIAIPEITEPLISKTPHIGISVLASLCGLNWIIKRRTRLMGATGGQER